MTVVGALIGWFTNFLAIKMLFRPIHPWRIPLIGLELQGLIPRRRSEIAASIGVTVEEQLISVKDMVSKIAEGESRQEIIRTIRVKVMTAIEDRIPSIIPNSIKQVILSKIRDILTQEVENFVDNSMGDMIEQSLRKVNIRSMVEERINALELEEVERLILEIASRELKYIELLGGVLGAVIGLIQSLLILVIQ